MVQVPSPFRIMLVPSLVKTLSFAQYPGYWFCTYLAHLARKIESFPFPHLLELPPSVSKGFFQAFPIVCGRPETDLIRVLINLFPLAKQSQEAKCKGTAFFFLPQDTLLWRELRAHCVFLGANIFLGKVQGFHICPKPNTHETWRLNSTEPFKSLASPWLTTTPKACCISFILAVFQSSWQTENKHTTVPLLPSLSHLSVLPDNHHYSRIQESQIDSQNKV